MIDRWVVVLAGAVAAAFLALAGHSWLAAVPVCVALWAAAKMADRGPRLFSVDQRRQLLERDGPTCMYCGRRVHYRTDCPFGGCDLDYQADHIAASSRGGRTVLSNAAVSCAWCNSHKSARPVGEFLADPDGDGIPGI